MTNINWINRKAVKGNKMRRFIVRWEIGEEWAPDTRKFKRLVDAEDADMAVVNLLKTEDEDGDPLSSIIMLRVTRVERVE